MVLIENTRKLGSNIQAYRYIILELINLVKQFSILFCFFYFLHFQSNVKLYDHISRSRMCIHLFYIVLL